MTTIPAPTWRASSRRHWYELLDWHVREIDRLRPDIRGKRKRDLNITDIVNEFGWPEDRHVDCLVYLAAIVEVISR